MRTDYVDILQAHDVEFGNLEMIMHETIPAMRELQRAGKVRFIGVTGFLLHFLRRLLRTAM